MINLNVTEKNPLSIHEQLMEQLKYHIEVGSWSPGAQLPTLRELADRLRINYNTARLAYRELEREGYVISRQGRGTFVASDPPRLPEGKHEDLFDIIDEAVAKARAIGVDAGDLARMVSARTRLYTPDSFMPRLLFTECNQIDLNKYAERIEAETGVQPDAIVLEDLEARPAEFFQQYDLITTTLFHVVELQAMVAPTRTVLGLMIKPSYLNMFSEIIQYPSGQRIGLIGENEHDATNMKRVLLGASTHHLDFLTASVEDPDRLTTVMKEADHLFASRHALRAHGDPWPVDKPIHQYEDDLDDAALRMLRRQIARLRTNRLKDEAASAPTTELS